VTVARRPRPRPQSADRENGHLTWAVIAPRGRILSTGETFADVAAAILRAPAGTLEVLHDLLPVAPGQVEAEIVRLGPGWEPLRHQADDARLGVLRPEETD